MRQLNNFLNKTIKIQCKYLLINYLHEWPIGAGKMLFTQNYTDSSGSSGLTRWMDAPGRTWRERGKNEIERSSLGGCKSFDIKPTLRIMKYR